MASLSSYQIQNSFKDLLTVLDANNPNSGLSGTLKAVNDGNGGASALYLSTAGAEIKGDLNVTGSITASNIGDGSFASLTTTTGVIGRETALTSGNISLGTEEVSFKIGSDDHLKILKDGTIRMTSVSSAPSSPVLGDLVNINGEIHLATQ